MLSTQWKTFFNHEENYPPFTNQTKESKETSFLGKYFSSIQMQPQYSFHSKRTGHVSSIVTVLMLTVHVDTSLHSDDETFSQQLASISMIIHSLWFYGVVPLMENSSSEWIMWLQLCFAKALLFFPFFFYVIILSNQLHLD